MSAARIIFTPRTLGEFLQCHSTLQDVLRHLAARWPSGKDLIVGDIHRTAAEEIAAGGKSGVHVAGPPYRATDVRVSNLDAPQTMADVLGDYVNAKYIYDPARPALLVAVTSPHGTGPHIHLQVHPATALRGVV